MESAGTGQETESIPYTVYRPEQQESESNDCAFYTLINAAFYGLQGARPEEARLRTNWSHNVMGEQYPHRRQLIADLALASSPSDPLSSQIDQVNDQFNNNTFERLPLARFKIKVKFSNLLTTKYSEFVLQNLKMDLQIFLKIDWVFEIIFTKSKPTSMRLGSSFDLSVYCFISKLLKNALKKRF